MNRDPTIFGSRTSGPSAVNKIDEMKRQIASVLLVLDKENVTDVRGRNFLYRSMLLAFRLDKVTRTRVSTYVSDCRFKIEFMWIQN